MELKQNSEGFLCDYEDWNDETALFLANENQLELTPSHWEIILFIRNYYQQFQYLPNARIFTKAIAHQLGVEKGNSRYLHGLFPQGPLKYACKIAGLPKPPTCL
ncbi:MAG: TusE/DsrC/DsvC family sulfur relay protein [Methylococcales bacterium]|nr:TusE/DsrC/DsvC family sulfur relay protein [Methylococcales bacterium]